MRKKYLLINQIFDNQLENDDFVNSSSIFLSRKNIFLSFSRKKSILLFFIVFIYRVKIFKLLIKYLEKIKNEIFSKVENLISRIAKLKKKNVIISLIELVQFKKRVKRLKIVITIFQKLVIQLNNQIKIFNNKSNIRVRSINILNDEIKSL